MKVEVINIEGKATGKEVELPDSIFGVEPNDHVLYLAVKSHRANQRQGTHKSKERGEIKGSTKKIKRQKGTGTARFGDIKNPLFKGGGRIFGPEPRTYGIKLNKKVKSLAKRSALSYKASSGNIKVVEDFTLEAPQTSAYVEILSNMGLTEQKALFVLPHNDRNVYLSGRNLKKVRTTTARQLNTYDVMNAQCLVLAEGAVELIEQNLENN